MVASNNKSIFIHGSSVRKSKIKALVGLAPSKVFWEVAFFFFLTLLFFSSLVCFLLLPASAGIPWLMVTSLQSLPPSSRCLLCYVRLWVLFFSWHPAPDFIALNTSCNHFIFLPSSCPPTPPSIFKTYLPCVQLCSGRPPATQTSRISSLKTHSLVIINNFTVFYEVIDHWCAHPSPTVGSMRMEAWSILFITVSFPPAYSRCSKKNRYWLNSITLKLFKEWKV